MRAVTPSVVALVLAGIVALTAARQEGRRHSPRSIFEFRSSRGPHGRRQDPPRVRDSRHEHVAAADDGRAREIGDAQSGRGPLLRLDEAMLAGAMRRYGTAAADDDPRVLPGGNAAVAFAWITLPGMTVPRALTHTIAMRVVRGRPAAMRRVTRLVPARR